MMLIATILALIGIAVTMAILYYLDEWEGTNEKAKK